MPLSGDGRARCSPTGEGSRTIEDPALPPAQVAAGHHGRAFHRKERDEKEGEPRLPPFQRVKGLSVAVRAGTQFLAQLFFAFVEANKDKEGCLLFSDLGNWGRFL